MTVVEAVLLLYHRPLTRGASTIQEHIDALPRYSKLPVLKLNTDEGMPPRLEGLAFRVVVLHYSLFPPGPYHLQGFEQYLRERSRESYLVAFFQDEHHHCRRRFGFIDDVRVDCVYTLIPPPFGERLYKARTRVSEVGHTLPGYVGDDMIAAAARYARASTDRSIDIGYRGRALPAYMGSGAREKVEIGERFAEQAAAQTDLVLDISSAEHARLYGASWSRFMGNCRGMLGTESGVSIFDLDDRARAVWQRDPAADFAAFERAGAPETSVPYRTISPRHFEAAAFGTVQVMYEGEYSGILEPDVHYIALAKDFSNFAEVVARFRDARAREAIAASARRDLIEAGRWSYARFVEHFDQRLAGIGMNAGDPVAAARAARALRHGAGRRRLARTLRHARHSEFPGRAALARALGRRQ